MNGSVKDGRCKRQSQNPPPTSIHQHTHTDAPVTYLDDGAGGERDGVGDLVGERQLARGGEGLEPVDGRADAPEAEVELADVPACSC